MERVGTVHVQTDDCYCHHNDNINDDDNDINGDNNSNDRLISLQQHPEFFQNPGKLWELPLVSPNRSETAA
jgi:hypothetical protein